MEKLNISSSKVHKFQVEDYVGTKLGSDAYNALGGDRQIVKKLMFSMSDPKIPTLWIAHTKIPNCETEVDQEDMELWPFDLLP